MNDLHYGVLVKDITPEYESVKLQVLDVKNEKPKSAEFPLPTLEVGKKPVNSRAGFEEARHFPPPGWELNRPAGQCLSAGPSRRSHRFTGPALSGPPECARDTDPRRAALRLARQPSPVRPMSWRLRADIKPAELQMEKGLVIHPLAFLAGDDLVAAACLRKIRSDEFVAGVLIRSADGLFRERIDVSEGEIFRNGPVRWELELLRVGTRQTTAVVRLNNNVVARINGDTTSVEPDAGCVGILHRHSGLQITLHVDQLLLTEAPR